MKDFLLNLQFFAEGSAAGGDGETAAGVTAPDAGEQIDQTPRTSRQLERARRQQKQVSGQAATAAEPAGATLGAQQEADPKPEPAARPSFEELIKGDYKQDFDNHVQDILRKRFKDQAGREQRDQEVNELMLTVSQMLGRTDDDPGKLSPKELREALLADDSTLLDAVAMDKGQTASRYREELQMRTENQLLRAQASARQQQEQQLQQDMRQRQAYEALRNEAESLKQTYADLDLDQMLQDPQTMRTMQALQIAGAQNPVRTIYEAQNRDRILGSLAQTAQRRGQQEAAAAVAANQRRPPENGLRSQSGLTVTTDVRNLSKAQREEIRQRVRRGEKITF